MRHLQQAFIKHREKIKRTQCVVVEDSHGWYHTHKRDEVRERLAKIDEEIERLEDSE